MRLSTVPVGVLAAGVLVVAGCSADAGRTTATDSAGTTDPDTTAPVTTDSGTSPATSAPDTSQATAGEGTGFECRDAVCLNSDAEYAKFDPGGELSVVEQALMREPGPQAGEDFDAQAVFDAAKATEPGSAREWSEAILTQMHPDYVQDAQDVIMFDPTIEGVPQEPAEEYRDVEVVGQNHFAILLDASGSMAESSGGESRMTQAKSAIEDFVGQLPEGSTMSLRVYGHEGSNKESGKDVSCESSEVVYEGDQAGLGESMDGVEPVGWTPLALAVRESVQDIPEDASDAIVYVVTDGIETCGGEPVAATQELANQGVKPVVNVIGFEVGTEETQQLRDMAAAGGGQYTDVSSQADLEQYWEEDMQAMMDAWTTGREMRWTSSTNRAGPIWTALRSPVRPSWT